MSVREPDARDQALIDLLRANAREPTASLARKLGLSRSAVQERIQRLERDGLITGYTLRAGPDRRVAGITAHVMLSLDQRQGERAVQALKALPEVRACLAVSGGFDLIAIVQAPSTEALDRLLDRIAALPAIARTSTAVVLATKFDRR